MASNPAEVIAYDAVVLALARAFVSGEQTEAACVTRGTHVLGTTRDWVTPLANRYLVHFAGHTRPRQRDVVRFLMHDPLWAWTMPAAAATSGEIQDDDPEEHVGTGLEIPPEYLRIAREEFVVRSWLTEPFVMAPVPTARAWKLPEITSEAALAEWLGLSAEHLAWFADLKFLTQRSAKSPLRHYHYRVVEKQSGGIRVIEAPQMRLKAVQQKILREILDRVPAYYDAAHGFVKGRSVKTFAAPHVGQRVVVRMDLQNFFPCIGRSRVQAVFRTFGYPEPVANLLAALCTTVAPRELFAANKHPALNARLLYDARKLYTRAHLPQGAPTSPSLANICAYRLDCRLTGLADWAGASYTRYADDLAFSGGAEIARLAERYATEIAVIASSEGFSVHYRKTRIMRQGVRQHIAGVVVNKTLNVRRSDYDALKAILANCVRFGPASQNRDNLSNFRASLAGRVAWVASLSPKRGTRLKEIFSRVPW